MRLIIRLLVPLALLLAFLTPASTATAAPAESERFQTVLFDENTCNGEEILGEGTIHFVFKEQKDGSFLLHANLHGTAVGTQGNEYVLNFTRKDRFISDPAHFTMDFKTVLVSKGSAPNQVANFHLDSDSGVTVDIDCRG
jgi:hypothetical protein